MNLLVLIKQVPDTEATIKIAADQKAIVETGVKFIINPYDEFALEEALRIKETKGSGSITVLCLGPERAKEALRSAIAMGADEALLLKATDMNLDGLTTAKALAEIIKGKPYDLILMGKEAIDDGNMQVGPMVATLLDIPCITQVTKLTVETGQLLAEREGDGGVEVLSAPLPCIITCQKGLNEPRYPSIRGVMLAKKKEIPEQAISLPVPRAQITKLEYPPTRSGGKIVGEGPEAVPALVKALHEEVKVI